MNRGRKTASELRRELVGDSIERRRLMDRFVALIREEERNRVLAVVEKTREAER